MDRYPKFKFCSLKSERIDLANTIFFCMEPQAENIDVYKNVIKSFKGNRKIDICKKNILDFPEKPEALEQLDDLNEAYGIVIADDKIDIYCSENRGFYYGMLDISDMIQRNELYQGYIYDYPDMNIRGIIEGFYGRPWSMDERLDSIKTVSEHKMNTYIYAPKDDSYHRDKWYKPYPDEELDKIKKLYHKSCEHYIDFVYSISPGLSMKYSDDTDFEKLVSKLMQVYRIGVRKFAIMFDDIPGKLMNKGDMLKFSSIAAAHAYIANKVYNHFKRLDEKSSLMICPTLYFGRGSEDYIVNLGKAVPDNIDIFWTGRAICSQELDTRDAQYFYQNTGHKPLYWDNYPVNDAEMINEMHLGPVINRDQDLYTFSRGLVSNVMEYKESSMIPVITAAHYLWNSREYDSSKSIEKAVRQVAGERDSQNFLHFIKYCSRSCIKITACEEFLDEMMQSQFLIINGSPVKALFRMQKFFKKGLKCGNALLNMENKKLLCEIKPWLDKYIEFNSICLEAINCRIMKVLSKRKYKEMKEKTLRKYNNFKNNPIEMMSVEMNMLMNSMLD